MIDNLGIDLWNARFVMQRFKCQRCGLCCLHHGRPQFMANDWKRLKKEGRAGLLKHPLINPKTLDILRGVEAYGSLAELKDALRRLEKETGLKFPWGGTFTYCPFLKCVRKGTYECLIQDVKPEGCRRFPVTWYGLNTNYVKCPELTRLGFECTSEPPSRNIKFKNPYAERTAVIRPKK